MKAFVLLATLILVTGCNPIKGIFSVDKEFVVSIQEEVRDPYCRRPPRFGGPRKRPRPGSPDCYVDTKKKDVLLQAGSYSAELNFNSNREISLEFKDQSDEKIDIEMTIPKGVKIPESFGQFSLTAAEMKQNFDLTGEVDTVYSQSDVYSGVESCTYTTTEYVCKRVRPKGCKKKKREERKRDGSCRPKRVCRNKLVTHYGEQDVEFHYKYETKNVAMELFSPDSDEQLAQFTGSLTESRKVYDYVGRCY